MTDIMKIIREERQRQGLSQEKLAYLAQVNKTSIHFWETYRYIPKFDLVVNMLDALGLEIVIQRKDFCSTCIHNKPKDEVLERRQERHERDNRKIDK